MQISVGRMGIGLGGQQLVPAGLDANGNLHPMVADVAQVHRRAARALVSGHMPASLAGQAGRAGQAPRASMRATRSALRVPPRSPTIPAAP